MTTRPLGPAVRNDEQERVPWSAIATLASVVALSQFFFIRRQSHREQVLLLRDLSASWNNLRGAWDRAILLARGPDDHYVNASDADKAAVASGDDEVVRAHEVSAQDVIRFLASIAMLVLDGKLKPSTAYAALGTEVVRNSRPLRTLTEHHPPPAAWAMTIYIEQEWMEHDRPRSDALRFWASYHVGTKRRLDIILDILWAQAVRLRDLPMYDVAMAAEVKELFDTGRRNRDRSSIEAWRLRRPYVAIRLRRLLRAAEYRSITNPFGVARSAARREIQMVARV